MGEKMKKIKSLSYNDQHALAVYFAMHWGANEGKKLKPNDVERTLFSVFGFVTKNGPMELTPQGKRCLKLAKQD